MNLYQLFMGEPLRGRVAREELAFHAQLLGANPLVAGLDRYGEDLAYATTLLDWMPENALLRAGDTVERWRRKLAWARGDEAGEARYSPGTVVVREPLTVAGMSEWREDPEAPSGKAARHKGGQPWGVQYFYTAFSDFLVPGKTYVARLRWRPELEKKREGAVLGFMSFRHGDDTPQGTSFGAELGPDDPGGYRTTVLGRVRLDNPSATGMFWLNAMVGPDEALWYR